MFSPKIQTLLLISYKLSVSRKRIQSCFKTLTGTSLVVQWLILRTSTAEGSGSICGRGTKISRADGHRQTKIKKEKKTFDRLAQHHCQLPPHRRLTSSTPFLNQGSLLPLALRPSRKIHEHRATGLGANPSSSAYRVTVDTR